MPVRFAVVTASGPVSALTTHRKMKPGFVFEKGAREAALRALVRVERDRAYLNLALPPYLKKLGDEDRALAMQIAAGTIQRLNTLDWALKLFSHRPLKSYTPWMRNLLRLSAYQIIYLEGIPDYAAVDEAVRLAYRFGHRGVASLVNALLRRLAARISELPWPDCRQNKIEYLSLRESHPPWLVKRYIENYGFEEAEQLCRSNNLKPLTSIRPNLLRNQPGQLAVRLASEGVATLQSDNVPGMLLVCAGGRPAVVEAFKEGLFTIQGESSAIVAPLMDPQPGEIIVDLCSAPGGKTTHIAELMGDSGLVYAVDIHHHRLNLVNKAARRLGLKSIQTIMADGRFIGNKKIGQPRAVLVDAPCSGLGVIRRLPELKWRSREENIAALSKLQLSLLGAAADLLPVGGKLLYSVCTDMVEETCQVFEIFSAGNSDFEAEALVTLLPNTLQRRQTGSHMITFLPHRHDLDGFFIASWLKKG